MLSPLISNQKIAMLYTVLAVLIFLCLSAFTFNQIEEDAFIYFRAAENIAHGYGYVFSSGEFPLETGSSVLWQAQLVLLSMLPFNIVIMSKLLGAVYGVLCIVLTSHISGRLIKSNWRFWRPYY